MSNNRTHPLFQRYPLNRTAPLPAGTLPAPYHVYDGTALLIGGSITLGSAMQLLAGQAMKPYVTLNRRCLLVIWVCDFTDASLGPHQELQFSLIAAHDARPPVAAHPLSILKILALDPAARLLAHHIWNDTEPAVTYNRDYLGLDAGQATGTIQQDKNRVNFAFTEAATDATIVTGKVAASKRTSFGTMIDMMRFFGFSDTMRFAGQSTLTATVVNTRSTVLPRNVDAPTFTHNDRVVLREWDEQTDELQITYPAYADFDFRPLFVEQMTGFKFVYLHPDDDAADV
ncbi:hypothetical protein ACFLYO_05255 [Chloroflexota bacterium]